ncbi:MAG: hypothetical protein A2Z72_01720 [Omnitrophica bacterium RBG_13_46_9]|nr:MAG: hypothetical protein A2Z72_01720 [Omnitrophica bacterium RBG_13_46_9]
MVIESLINDIRERYSLDKYKAERAIITAPFGADYFHECITRWDSSRAIVEFAKNKKALLIIVTSKDVPIEAINGVKDYIVIQADEVPGWRSEYTYLNRLFKWAIPFLFKYINVSLYIDSDLHITNHPNKIIRLFDTIKNHKFCVTEHPLRSGWLEEIDAIVDHHYLCYDTLMRQKEYYISCKMPAECPVYQNNIIGRVHGTLYDQISLEVLKQVNDHSERDQLALCYALWRLSLRPFALRLGEMLYTRSADSSRKVNMNRCAFIDPYSWRFSTYPIRPELFLNAETRSMFFAYVRFKYGMW